VAEDAGESPVVAIVVTVVLDGVGELAVDDELAVGGVLTVKPFPVRIVTSEPAVTRFEFSDSMTEPVI
jgi:hypothetical protein